ncbi:MAG: ATP-binding protein, partial [Burkholderiaceae bacterium]
MPLSIRTRLLLLVLCVMMPGVFAALWVSWQAWNAEKDGLIRHMRDSTRALSMVVDKEIERRAGIARVLSLSQMLDNAPLLAPEDLATLELQSRRAMEGMAGWVELTSGDRLLFTTRPPAKDAAASAAAVPPPAAVEKLSDRLIVAGLRPDPATREQRAEIVQPVERNGQVLLNMSVTLLPKELQQIIDAQGLPADWMASVMDSNGVIVARHPGGTARAGQPVTDDLKRLMAASQDGVFESTNLDGVPVLGYFSTSPKGWTFLTAVSRESVLGGRASALQPTVIGALFLVLGGFAGALWISRRIAGPIHELNDIANALRAGEPVKAHKTGMIECDEVALALADASVAIRQGRTELEERVNDAVVRTRETEQLSSRAQRVAALGRLTGGVAHDFNNLLGVISNSAHLIQRAVPPDAVKMPIGAIMRSVEVGSRLTQHLLRVAGRQPVHPQLVATASTLGEMKELLATVLGKRMQLAVTIAPDTKNVLVDASELELALINIALNTRDATNGMGEVQLDVRNAEPGECQDLEPGDYVLISFTDQGPGIPEEVQSRVFEPFFTTKAVGKGTGLGLSQVMGFCVQAGGTARINSQPGQATTVSLLLPARAS